MDNEKTNLFLRVCRVISLALGLLLIGSCIAFRIGLDLPKASYTTTPLSLKEYSGGHALPMSAGNVYFANAQRGFVGFVDMYRFDAPTADCIAYGKKLLKENEPFWDADLTSLESPPEPMGSSYLDAMGLSQVNWFDIDTIRSGYVGHRDASVHPSMTFWIDADRGRFYFYSSD